MTERLALGGRGGGSSGGTLRVVVSSGSPMMPVCRFLVSCSGMGGGGSYCLEDVVVSSAAAEVATYGSLDIVRRGVGVVFHEGGAAHDHAWGAEAALHGVVVDEGLLDGVEHAVLREAFDGGDLFAPDVVSNRHATGGDFAIDPDRAGRAGSAVAADFGAGEAEA